MRSMIQNIVKQTLGSALGDLPVQVILRSTSVGTYDPATGTVARTVAEITVRAILTGINDKDTNDLELLTKGKKVLIAGLDLQGVEIDALDDTVIVDGLTYQLKSYKVDPAGALYSLMIIARTPNAHGI